MICCDFGFYFFVNVKMSYYWLNKQELLQKAKNKHDSGGKEKAAKYYLANKDVLKKKQRVVVYNRVFWCTLGWAQ